MMNDNQFMNNAKVELMNNEINIISGTDFRNTMMNGTEESKETLRSNEIDLSDDDTTTKVPIFHLKQSENRHKFAEEMVRIHEKVKKSQVPNCKVMRIPIFSKINVEFLEMKLRNYGDKEIVDLMRFGAPIGLIRETLGVNLHVNHMSAKLYPKDIDNYIEKEIGYQAVLGPFNSNPV